MGVDQPRVETASGLLADDEFLLASPSFRRPRRTLLTSPLQPFRLSKRQSFLLYTAAAVLLLLFFGGVPRFGASRLDRMVFPQRALHVSHLRHLASGPDGTKERDLVAGENHAVVIDLPKENEEFTWVDTQTRKEFVQVMTGGLRNAALGRMPGGGAYDMLVIGQGKSNLFQDRKEGKDHINTTMVGFFVAYDHVLEEWKRAGPEPEVLSLPAWRQSPSSCEGELAISAGPLEARFLWSDAGEPLALFEMTTSMSGVCRSVAIVDLRAVWPAFKTEMEEMGYGEDNIPVRWGALTELSGGGKKSKEARNWAPFFEGPAPGKPKGPATGEGNKEEGNKEDEDKDTEDKTSKDGKQEVKPKRGTTADSTLSPSEYPLFAASVAPRAILAASRSDELPVAVKPIDLKQRNKLGAYVETDFRCLLDQLPEDWSPERLRHATPLQRVTFCERGACVPDTNNTALLGVVEYESGDISRRFFVTTEVYPPFEPISVSSPLRFASSSPSPSSLTLTFLPTSSSAIWGENPYTRPNTDTPSGWLSHGWLNDTLLVGGGLTDGEPGQVGYNAVQMPVREALSGHRICRLGKEYEGGKQLSSGFM